MHRLPPLAAALGLALAPPLFAQGPTVTTAPPDTVRATWNSGLDQFRSAPAVLAVVCPPGGTLEENVWGTDEYTDDSGICKAAVHAGLFDLNGGVAVLERRPGLGSYRGSVRHGVTTSDYPAWPRGFRFLRVVAAPADPADAATIDGVLNAWYGAISGPVGAPRDWARDAALYLPGAVFAIAGEGGAPRTATPSAWARENDAGLVRSGFVEREIHRLIHEFGRMAHVWSTYEWETADGETGRGINSIHLWHDGQRWWITHATWDNETPERPIPPEYLPR